MVGSVCLVALLFLATFAQIEVTPLNFNQLVHDSVQADSWRFYSFTTAANTGFLLNIQHGSKYDLDVFVRKGYEVPSRQTFDYSETGTLSNITINGRVESQSTHYIVGVFGFRGTAVPFSIMVTASNGCPMDCSGHGSCVRQACSCIDGYAGEGCQYQVTGVDLGKKNGPFTLNKGEWKYWSIYLFSTQSLHILTNRLSRDGDVDFYVRRAQIPTLFDYDYADLTRFTPEHNSFTLNISNPLLGNWFIGAFSFETTTFDWTVYSSVSCPNNCSLHGSCVGVSCSCNGDFYGVACEELRYPVQLGQVYRGYVSENTWNYYTAIANSLNSMLITVQHPNDGSDCDLYIRTGENPSLTTFSARNITMDPTMTLLVPSPGEQQIKIGVYGYSRCSYTLKVSIVAADDCDCSHHGRCANGLCICDQGWAGSKCEVGTISLSNGVTARGAVAPGQWQFFSFPVHGTHQFVVIQKETETVGDNWLLIAMGTYPTLERYNAIDRQRSDYHRISFRFRSLFNATFFFGIYGNPNSPKKSFPFQIAAYQVPF